MAKEAIDDSIQKAIENVEKCGKFNDMDNEGVFATFVNAPVKFVNYVSSKTNQFTKKVLSNFGIEVS